MNGNTYTPYTPSKGTLKILTITELESVLCLHCFYSSPKAFINHLLWVLHPETIINNEVIQHLRQLTFQLRYQICINCINLVLSMVNLLI